MKLQYFNVFNFQIKWHFLCSEVIVKWQMNDVQAAVSFLDGHPIWCRVDYHAKYWQDAVSFKNCKWTSWTETHCYYTEISQTNNVKQIWMIDNHFKPHLTGRWASLSSIEWKKKKKKKPGLLIILYLKFIVKTTLQDHVGYL